jgi:AraC-like DNA-binding protein
MPTPAEPLQLLAFPYDRLRPLAPSSDELSAAARQPGSALVWCMTSLSQPGTLDMVSGRPGGLSLLVVLPPGGSLNVDMLLAHNVQRARPVGVLPHHPAPTAFELAQVLRAPPVDIGGEVTDYLRWRGLGIDRETAQLVRRIIDLGAELRTVTAVSRGMYLSRRALGRRLMSRGLPVPSHWLQFARLLRVALRLQNSDSTVSSIAFNLGYPDGFSVSNQMERLVGYRPSDVRARFGWEWILEAWLRKEAERGGLAPTPTCVTAALPRRERNRARSVRPPS